MESNILLCCFKCCMYYIQSRMHLVRSWIPLGNHPTPVVHSNRHRRGILIGYMLDASLASLRSSILGLGVLYGLQIVPKWLFDLLTWIFHGISEISVLSRLEGLFAKRRSSNPNRNKIDPWWAIVLSPSKMFHDSFCDDSRTRVVGVAFEWIFEELNTTPKTKALKSHSRVVFSTVLYCNDIWSTRGLPAHMGREVSPRYVLSLPRVDPCRAQDLDRKSVV